MKRPLKIIQQCRACPLCGSLQSIMLHEMEYSESAEIFLPLRYKIVCCVDCHFLFNDFSNSPDVFRKHYEQMLKYANPLLAGGGGSTVAEEQIWKLYFSMIKRYIPDKKTAILDLGCGKGGLLNYFRKKGYSDLTGVDPSASCIQSLHQHGINGIVGSIENIPADREFDLIISTGVFEHLTNPRNVLQTISGHLSPGGFVCIVVPDADRYMSSTEAPYYYFDREHINHFNGQSLSLLGKIHSLEPVLIRACNLHLANGTRNHYNLCAIFQKSGSSVVPEKFMKYLDKCKNKWDGMSLPDLTRYAHVFLWGIGAYAENMLASGLFRHVSNLRLLDVDPAKQEKMAAGMKISHPSVILDYNDLHSIVLITSVMYEKEIIMQLEKMNWRGGIHSIAGG